MHLETDVLIIGAGGAGMYAAIEAARAGASETPSPWRSANRRPTTGNIISPTR